MTMNPPENFYRGGSALTETINELKQRGCAILVTGNVREEIIAQECRSLFGSTDQDRYRILGLTDDNRAAPTEYFPIPSISDESSWVLNLGEQTRSVAETADQFGPPNYEAPPTAVLRWELQNALDHYSQNDLAPGMVRLGVNSLSHLIREDGKESVYRLVQGLNQHVRDLNGMAHYVFSKPTDEDAEATIEELMETCDIHVRLRKRRGVSLPEEKWHAPDDDLETEWIPFTEPGRD